MNRASFDQKVVHVNPVDGKNANRFYPGRSDGSQTKRASYLITREVIDKCDHLIDLHGGDLDESLRPWYLKVLPGTAEPVSSPVWIESLRTAASEEAGIFYPLVERGSYVAAGMPLGYVTDYFGKKVFEARAPVAGVVLYVCSVPSMAKGGTIASIGVVRPGE